MYLRMGMGLGLAQQHGNVGISNPSSSAIVFEAGQSIYFDDNTELVYTGYVLPEPLFSVDSGTFEDSVEITISHTDPEATIIYTTDGSEPVL